MAFGNVCDTIPKQTTVTYDSWQIVSAKNPHILGMAMFQCEPQLRHSPDFKVKILVIVDSFI